MSTTTDLRMLLSSPKAPQTLDENQERGQVSEQLALPRLKTDVDLNNDNTLFAVYCFIKNFIGLQPEMKNEIESYCKTITYSNILLKQEDALKSLILKYLDQFYPSASGTTTGAIDNKIEQAMDLVKTHLMLTVREEVEVLKDKITELMDRISQLEVENTILKAHASQETLSQLSTQANQKSQQPPSNSSA